MTGTATGPGTGPVQVRPAGPPDHAARVELPGLSRSICRTLADHLVRAQAGTATGAVALVAVDPTRPPGQRLLGVALGLRQHEDGHVLDLAVRPADRGRGHGRMLLRALIAALRDIGCTAVTLEVRAGNLAAQSLYRAEGFQPAGRRPRYYPDDEDALLWWWDPPEAAPPTARDRAAGAPARR